MLHLPKYLVELQVQDDVDKVEWEPGDSENQDHSNKQPGKKNLYILSYLLLAIALGYDISINKENM